MENVIVEPDRGTAISLLKTIANNNDVVIIAGEDRTLVIHDNCIHYANKNVDNNIPITNDIFILADIVREKYKIKPRYNIFTDAKIDGGI